MSKDNELPDLSQKGINVEAVAAKSLEDERVFQILLDGISPVSKKHAIRGNSYEALMCLAGGHPTVLFPHWNYFIDLLESNNKFSAYCAVHLVAALAEADVEGRFETIFGTFYNLLDNIRTL